MSPTPAQWKCPQCQHEMITSGVDMESYEQMCHERDVMDEQRRELLGALKLTLAWIEDHDCPFAQDRIPRPLEYGRNIVDKAEGR